jgi:hypothetical protein
VEATLYHDVISTTDSANIEVALQNHCGASSRKVSYASSEVCMDNCRHVSMPASPLLLRSVSK